MGVSALIGREQELDRLEGMVPRATGGDGALALLSGEAGVGKTRLVDELAARAEALVLRGAAAQGTTGPYAPIVAAIRAHLRSAPDALDECGPLAGHLALLMPELGEPPAAGDRETLFEALRRALVSIAREGPALLVLDDLQWSDDTTLELLAWLARSLEDVPVLIVGAYRSDEIPRGHPLRRLRTELRRSGNLEELALEPLDPNGTAALAAAVLGSWPADSLAATVHDRTQGYPFFVEELTAALRDSGALTEGSAGLELNPSEEVPVPATVRDAVLMRLTGISAEARSAAEAAAVAGESFELELVAALSSADGLAELADCGLIGEEEGGRARFRHALAREALYRDVPWLRRKRLHRELAEALERAGAGKTEIATHWVGAREDVRAREALLEALDASCALHAYRDAARAGRDALELWPEGDDESGRLEAVERYAHCAELAGELAEAVRAWREAAALRRRQGVGRALADAERRLAGAYGLQGDRKRGLAARLAAAEAFAAIELPGEAASDRLVAVAYLQSSGDHAQAVEGAQTAAAEAERAGRTDLRARALGLEGAAQAKRGEFEAGLETVRAGLSLALEHDLTAEAADTYQRLGTVLETSGDYGGAREALESALRLCEATGDAGQEQGCVACIAYVQRELGEWDQAAELSETLNADSATPDSTRVVSDGILGSIHAFRGDAELGHRLLHACQETARRLSVISMDADSTAALAWLARSDGDEDGASVQCRELLERWAGTEDRHYAIWGLRFAAEHFARAGDSEAAQTCAEALARVASDSGHEDALAGLAHALGETALLEGDADVAAQQMERAVELHRALEIPFERAQIQLRAGVALAAAGERETALERLTDAYRGARKLGARPLAVEITGEVAALGESVEKRLGRRAAAAHEGAGLSRRELEVLRLAAVGRTNREIAGELYLSPRTVEMHIRNMLAKLGCRSRVEAASRARELGVL